MKIGDRVTVVLSDGGQVIEHHITYTDEEKSCGWARISDKTRIVRKGDVVGFKSGWFNDCWLVGLDDGSIVRVPA